MHEMHEMNNRTDYTDIKLNSVFQENERLRFLLEITESKLDLTRAEIQHIKSSLTWRLANSIRMKLEKVGLFRNLFTILMTMKEKDTYATWFTENSVNGLDRMKIEAERIEASADKPQFFLILHCEKIDENKLLHSVNSVRNQIYGKWFLVLLAKSETGRKKACNIFEDDERFEIVSSTDALKKRLDSFPKDAFVAAVSQGDTVAPQALFELAGALNAFPHAKMIYSDEDRIDAKGNHFSPYFKSAWNPDYLLSRDYVGDLLAVRSDAFSGDGLDEFLKPNRHGFLLHLTSRLNEVDIVHVPEVLYHRDRKKDVSQQVDSAAVQSHFEEQGIKATVTKEGKHGFYHVRYHLDREPPVSVIIPTRDQVKRLAESVSGVLKTTAYDRIELIIVDNNSSKSETKNYFDTISHDPRVRILRYPDEFNFSAMNNMAVQSARGELVLLLNNDIKVLNPDWMTEMVGHAVNPDIGCVGALLVYPNGRIQHAGVLGGVGGFAGHAHRFALSTSFGYHGDLQCTRNVVAVTGACLMVRKELYEKAGGLDERFKVDLNDIDFCLTVRSLGYRNVFTPWAKLVHYEAVSRGSHDTPLKCSRLEEERLLFLDKWAGTILNDPYYNPNLSLLSERFILSNPPRQKKPRTIDM